MVNNLSPITTITVDTSRQVYPVSIGHGLLQNRQWFSEQITSQHIFIITDTVIAPFYLEMLYQHFADRVCHTLIMEVGEHIKTLQHAEYIYDQLIEKRFPRDGVLIALGGGVIGDLVGFVASTYQRGVDVIHVPTSLLAQVDASIGGKTAVNHKKGKNMIGTFYQPRHVIIDTQTLQTLPVREYRAGLAEVLKYAVLKGGSLSQLVGDACKDGLATKLLPVLTTIITACCKVKAEYVAADENEQDIRAFLNLGHTFGHALETVTGYQQWLHGEAVAIGLYCAALLSLRIGLCDAHFVTQVDELLQLAQLPRRIPNFIDKEQLSQAMWHDKKIKNQKLRFIVMKDWGQCQIVDDIENSTVIEVLQQAYEN